jgi:hypothetical protein
VTFLPLTDRRVRGLSHEDYPLTLTLIPAIPEVCAHPFCDVSGRENLELHELWPRSFLRKQPIEFVQLPDETIVRNQVYLCNAFNEGHHQQITENKSRIAWMGNPFDFAEWQDRLEEDRWDAQAPLNPHPWRHAARTLLLPPPDDSSPRPVGSGEEKGKQLPDSFYEDRPEQYERIKLEDGSHAYVIRPEVVERGDVPPKPLDWVKHQPKATNALVGLTEPHRDISGTCPTCKRKLPVKKEKLEKERKRTTWSIRVPKDHLENGAEILDSLLEECRDILGRDENEKTRYYTLVESLALLLQHDHLLEKAEVPDPDDMAEQWTSGDQR